MTIRESLIGVTTLTLAAAWASVAMAQVRQPGEIAKTLAVGPPELNCTIAVSNDPTGTRTIPEGRTIAMGSSLWVHFTVVNQGLAPASGFVSLVRVEKTVTYPGTLVHEENPTQTPLTLGVGQSATLSPIRVDLDPGPDNKIQAQMFVDHGNAVAEKDEDNNWCTAYYTAQTTPSAKPKQALASQAAQQAPPSALADRAEPEDEPDGEPLDMKALAQAVTLNLADLSCMAYGSRNEDGSNAVPYGGTLEVQHALINAQVYLQVVVRNTGKVQAGGFATKVTVERNGTKLDEHTKTLIVGPGLSYRWPIPLPLGGTEGWGQVPYLGGTNVFKASVVSDAGAFVPEGNEANNSCATQFSVDFTYGP